MNTYNLENQLKTVDNMTNLVKQSVNVALVRNEEMQTCHTTTSDLKYLSRTPANGQSGSKKEIDSLDTLRDRAFSMIDSYHQNITECFRGYTREVEINWTNAKQEYREQFQKVLEKLDKRRDAMKLHQMWTKVTLEENRELHSKWHMSQAKVRCLQRQLKRLHNLEARVATAKLMAKLRKKRKANKST